MGQHVKQIVCGLVALLILPAIAGAGGFSLYEQSASASGRGGAFTAGADDASANWYNPANLAWLEESEFQVGASAVFAGAGTKFTSSDPEFLLARKRKFDAVGHVVVPLHLYYAGKINERMAWGVGVNSPFGLVSEWKDVPVTLAARKSSLLTVLVNPNLAFRLSDQWSVAVGLDYMYTDVQDFSADVSLGIGPGPSFLVAGKRNLTGTGDDWGWNVAASYRGDGFRAGFSYRAAVTPQIDGNLRFSNSLKPPLMDSPARASLNFPALAMLGAEWDVTDKWVVEGDLAWTDWSTFDVLAIDVRNEIPGLLGDIRLRQDWKDTMSYRLGTTWHRTDRQQWRFGAFWDESPTRTDTLRPSIPDSNRWSVSVGYGYTGDHWGVDVYYMPLIFTDKTARGAAAEGVIDGTYSSYGHLAGVTLSWTL